MFNRIIVPVDGSDASWRAASVADHLAAQCDAELELLHAEERRDERERFRIAERVATTEWAIGRPIVNIVEADDAVEAIVDRLTEVNGGVIVMASSGRGRSEAVLGSVTEGVLRATFGPVIVVGPEVDPRAPLGGELVVTVDGSRFSETAIGLAGAWSIGLGIRPWVVNVVDPELRLAPDVGEINYAARLAHELQGRTGRETEFEVLHHHRPSRAITDFARLVGARMIVAATHGRSGLTRLTVGSVAAGIVRHAPCPVVLLRPPALAVRAEPRRVLAGSER